MNTLGIPLDYGTARGLPPQAEATLLVSIASNPDGREISLEPAAAAAWARMRDAAAADGLSLVAISGFRSVKRSRGSADRVMRKKAKIIGKAFKLMKFDRHCADSGLKSPRVRNVAEAERERNRRRPLFAKQKVRA